MATETTNNCRGCDAGPRGDRGHVDLRERGRFGGSRLGRPSCVHYSCAVCARIWERRMVATTPLWSLLASPADLRAAPLLRAA